MSAPDSKALLALVALNLAEPTQIELGWCVSSPDRTSGDDPPPARDLDELLESAPPGGRLGPCVREFQRTGAAARELDRCLAAGYRLIPWFAPDYPAALLDLAGPPCLLYVSGDGDWPPGPTITIVGSRKSTSVARSLADDLGAAVTASGAQLVSGLAYGVDQAAHHGGLRPGGPCWAVMAGGVDRVDPPGARPLAERIRDAGGLVSEVPLGTVPRPPYYPRRNRILAALSKVTVVVEAAERSGSLSTAHHALELGREVFAVPGSLANPQARGTNRLIRDGAHPLLEVADLLPWLPDRPRAVEAPSQWQQLLRRPCSVDQLSHHLKRPRSEILDQLLDLEIEGRIRRLGGVLFQWNP